MGAPFALVGATCAHRGIGTSGGYSRCTADRNVQRAGPACGSSVYPAQFQSEGELAVSQNLSAPFARWLPRLSAEGITGGSGSNEAEELSPRQDDWSRQLTAQFGLVTTAAAADPEPNPEDEISRLRERLTYYEHFDELIRDNVARSADLFRAAYAAKSAATPAPIENEFAAETIAARVDQRVYAERQHMQHILMSIMDEATYVQQRSDALIQRLAEALTELANLMPDEDEPVSGA